MPGEGASVFVRRATVEDAAAVAALHGYLQRMHTETHPDIFTVFDPEVTRPHFEGMLASDDALIWVAEMEGEAVGYAWANLVHREATALAHEQQFTRVRYDVTIASPKGGKVEFDTLSDPRDPSKWSSEDLISMGFVNTPELVALLEDTPTLADLNLDLFDAIVVCGGLAPMWQFRDSEDLKKTLVAFYEAEKPTAALCHGVSGLIDVRLSDGSYLVEGKTVTGFANVEEDFSDAAVGQKVTPFRIEDELRERGANYVQGGRFKSFVVRDGRRLITGQQHYSGAKIAEAVIAAIGV